jgi:hypothetical protein
MLSRLRRKNLQALIFSILLITVLVACEHTSNGNGIVPTHMVASDELRDEVIGFARSSAEAAMSNAPAKVPGALDIKGHWDVETLLYENGSVIAAGLSSKRSLGQALAGASAELVKDYAFAHDDLVAGRFQVFVIGKDGDEVALVEFKGKGLTLVGDVVAIPEVTKAMINQKISEGKNYLLNNMNKETHAFYKRYDIENNDYSTRVRTIYTASSLYTLMKLSDRDNDPRIQEEIPFIKDFLFSMQSDDEKTRGAFHYSYDVVTKEKDGRFKVGTTSKTIYTLLELYRRTTDATYLAAAEKAGEWLLSMQRPDGWVRPHVHDKHGELIYDERKSFLYTGQVLSALSRLYAVTQNERYLAGAEKIAALFISESEEQDFAVSDDYRYHDLISASWVAMSLLDYYKVSHDENAWDTLTMTFERLLEKQHNDPADLLNYGRFEGTLATSGNGWINEVLSELYLYCKQQGKDLDRAEQYKQASARVTRWLVQNTYSEENTFFLKDPEKAFGGLIRNREEETVRTDAVCHGLNGYINMLDE